MPTAYKSKLRVTCRVDTCIQDPLRANATEACFTCPEAACEILDLDDRVILAIGQLAAAPETPETAEPVKAKGNKKR
jgi:hypothetical protein